MTEIRFLKIQKMLKAFRLDASGNQIEIDLIEYAKTLNETTLIPTNTQEQLIVNDQLNNANHFQRTYVFIPFHTYSYTETRNYRTTGSPIKCTADMVGPCDITYGESETVSESFSASITLSGEKSAIQAGASFGWEHSVQTTSSFSVAYNVPAGKIGYIQFKPYYNVSVGNLTDTFWTSQYTNTKSVRGEYGMSPVRLANGYADGVFELMYK